MLAQLKSYLDYCLRAAQNPCYDSKTFFDQAFGAVQYQAYLDVDSSPSWQTCGRSTSPNLKKKFMVSKRADHMVRIIFRRMTSKKQTK